MTFSNGSLVVADTKFSDGQTFAATLAKRGLAKGMEFIVLSSRYVDMWTRWRAERTTLLLPDGESVEVRTTALSPLAS